MRGLLTICAPRLRSTWRSRARRDKYLMDAKMVRLAPDIYLNMKDYYRDPTLRPDAAALEQVQDVMIKTGFTKKRADISTLVD